MINKKITQAIVTNLPSIIEHRITEAFALFRADGRPMYEPIVAAGAIGTAAKTTPSPEPETNTIVPIKFTSGNTAASPTVAFNGGTARAIQLGGTASASAEITLAANGVALFMFDGTVLHQIGVYS